MAPPSPSSFQIFALSTREVLVLDLFAPLPLGSRSPGESRANLPWLPLHDAVATCPSPEHSACTNSCTECALADVLQLPLGLATWGRSSFPLRVLRLLRFRRLLAILRRLLHAPPRPFDLPRYLQYHKLFRILPSVLQLFSGHAFRAYNPDLCSPRKTLIGFKLEEPSAIIF